MAKISNKPIAIPSGIIVSLENNQVIIKSAQGQELRVDILTGIKVEIDNAAGQLVVRKENEERETKAFDGLIKTLIKNALVGLTKGYNKTLKLVGTGYRVAAQGAGINLALGFSHPIIFNPPATVKLAVQGSDTIVVSGFDKQAVGQVAAEIRDLRPPEPYKGKGIRYIDEVVRRKAGKAVVK